ncbi:MAG: ABC transporter ATP-binding protein [Clostridia bacterium]|nr:ABC transporter ATP-binding protein [Clostridia bacterium]
MKNSFIKITLKGTKSYIVLLIILSAIYSRLVVYVPMFIQYILDGVIVGKEEVIPSFIRALFDTDTKMTKIIILVLNLIFVNLVIVMVNFIKNKINVKFNLKINRNVKENILKHIPKLQYDEFHNIDKSDVIQRVNNDAATYAEFFNSQINLFFDTIFIVVFAIIQTVKLNLAVGLFIVGMSFLIIVLSIWHYKITKPLVEDIVEMNQEIISKTTTSVQESKMLKIFNRKEKKNFEDLNQKCKKKEMTFAKIRAAYVITTHSIRNFKEPFILLWGGILVVKGELTLAQVSILLSFATKITNYIYNSVEKVSFINEFLVASKKLSHLMKYKEEIEDKPTVKLNGDITFKNVSIKIKNNILLKNLNFTIQQTQNVAIVGNNGTGKTVIAKTLIGFYEYTGEIYIGKQNIKEVSKKSVRDYIGVVLQDTFLFTDTIQNNINITNKIVSKEEILNVCKLAQIYEDIKGFKENIEYPIGKGGNNLSGGQKQRIAIARTLLLDNKMIVFDDSLSKLDMKTKLAILDNLVKMKKGTIMISHDVEIVKRCDKVLWIHDQTIEVSTHDRLIKENMEYQQIIENNKNKILEDEEY